MVDLGEGRLAGEVAVQMVLIDMAPRDRDSRDLLFVEAGGSTCLIANLEAHLQTTTVTGALPTDHRPVALLGPGTQDYPHRRVVQEVSERGVR